MRPIELPLLVVHNRPFVELEYSYGAHGPHKAWTWLDTGGGSVILGRPLSESLQLPRTGEVMIEGSVSLTPTPTPVITAGGVALSSGDCRTTATDQAWLGPAAFQATAFLPAEFFRQYTVTFDYPGRRLRLEAPGTLPESTGNIHALIHQGTAFARIELDIAGERLGFLLDTGASYSMISEALWLR